MISLLTKVPSTATGLDMTDASKNAVKKVNADTRSDFSATAGLVDANVPDIGCSAVVTVSAGRLPSSHFHATSAWSVPEATARAIANSVVFMITSIEIHHCE